MTVTISRTTAPALVSSVTDNQQINPSIVALPNGGYAVLWQDYGARLGATFLQQYTAAGVKTGPETMVSGLPEFVRPSASTLPTGELLLTWTNGDIMSQRMSAAGALIGSPQTVNTTLAGAQSSPVATALQGGGYAVAWMSEDQDGSLMGVYAQRFDAAGAKVGAEFRVNTAVAGNQNNPALGALSDGGFVVTWESVIPGASGSPVGIYMQRYDASGAAAGAETLVSTHAVSPNFTASQSDPSVTGLTSGFVVVWQGRPSTPTAGIDPDEIYMQLYDASGAAVGGQTMVNTTTAHPQKLPVVTSLPDGGFVVAWLDGWAVGVSAQRFSATGERAGLETVLTNQHVDFDINPALAGLSGGGYAVAWAGNDGSGDGIYQSAVVAVTGGVLSAAVETAVGDSANDIFYAAPGTLNPGDRLDGGAGTDVLRMSSPGTIDLTGVTLTNIEALNGSSGDDTIIFPGAAPAGLYFYGAGGSDTLVFGADTNIGQFNTLSLPRVMAAPGAGVTFTLGAGQRSAIDDLLSIDGSGATVTADISSWGGALNAELRAKAFAHGVDFIQEPGGVTYSAAGAAIQAGSQISINPDAFAYTPDVAGLADGRVVVVSVGGGGFNGVGLQLFDAQGANLGAKAVGSESFVFDPAVAALSNGGFVVTWQGLDSEFTGIKARVFNAAGDPVGAVLQVNSNPAGQQFRPQVAALVNGGFVIGWDGEGGGLQRYTATGERVGAEISKLGGRLDLAALADGGFVGVAESVGFALPHGLYATRYAADGSKVGAEVLLSSSSAGAVSGLTGGGFVAVWSVGATSGASIHAQRFDASGAKAGPESIIGAEGVNWSTLDVAGTADGGFTVAWSSEEGAIGKAIHTQRFDALGLRIGKEAVFAGDFADSPDITALAGGGTALVWETGSSPHAQMLINAPLDYHALTAGADTIVGGSGATHVVALPDQVNSGDSVSGGAGIDTFELASPGVANLAGMASFTGFEIILAMNGDHTLIVSQAILEGLTKVDLGYGKNTLQLGAPGLLDVSNVSLRGFESLLGSSGNDTFVVRNVHAFTTIDGGDGIDTLTLNPEQIGQGWSLEPWSGTTVGVRVIGFENLTGSAFSEVLIGDAGPNVLSGLGGDDNLDGGRGNDTLLGGDGADTLTGGEGDDILDGGAGVDRASYSAATGAISINLTLSGPQAIGGGMGVDTVSGIEVVVGGAFADVLIGDAGDNTLTGDAGDDIIEGGPGDDILNGSSGIDTVSYSAATAGVTVNLSLVGTRDTLGAGRDNLSGFENIIGSAFSDILTGDPGANMLVGGGGNDILDGGGSADQLYGGAGDDTFRVNTQADLVFEFAGQGIDTVITTASFYLYDNIENLTLATGSADLFGVGNGLANTITGNAGANLLLGGGGDDVIGGGSGNDRLFGEDGNDVLSGGTGSDWMVGGVGADTLDGATGGVGEQDFLYGGAGDDAYVVDAANDLTFEDIGGGTDTVTADFAGGTYYLYANVENLTLAGTTANGVGNELDNVITGNASANWLLGGAGNDTLNGKGGGDVLFGQGGADTFVFERGTGGDVIGDFAVGVDKVRLTGIYSSFAEVQSHMVQNGGDSAIDLGQGDLVVFQHVAMASFSAGDFLF